MTRGLSFTLICGLSTFANAVTPNSATWSSQAYGPDGPWNAVLAKLGSNEQFVALYPGDRWASTILLDTVCSTPNLTSSCLAENAGTFDISQSSSLYIPSDNSNNTSDMTWVSSANDASVNKFGSVATVKAGQLGDTVYFAGMSVPNVSINGIYEAYQTYPNGNKYPVEVGTLALGGLAMNQTVDNVTYNMVESYAWRTGSIPSYSWGMHIGAAGDSYIPGSLVMGGYDQDRIVGNVSSQPVNTTNDLGTLDIPLFDIGLGVAAGGSPWSFKSKNGLFKRSNGTSESSASVEIDPTRPYLYLPQDTCDAIAEQLPVTYNEGLGLYFWNTTVDKFEKITGSPAYLSFTFENNAGEDSSNPNTTIKVPFKLLKLTLESPLVDQNTTYFPCYPSDDYVLGRAFLQAAFLGTNWQHGNGTGYWFFAQAPGPNIQSGSVQTIGVTDTTVTGSSEAWENTWSGYWNVMPPHGGGGLSQGAKIGIGIGCGVAGAAAICVIGLLVARCMRKGKNVDPSEEEATELTTSNNQTEVAGPPPDTADTQNTAENSENASHSVNAFEQISVASAPEQTDSHEVYGGDKPPRGLRLYTHYRDRRNHCRDMITQCQDMINQYKVVVK
ncbi:hypothetical protein N7454_004192 [Penicillium verhagenii]|nr:hypothetical protein N7454_004192 [Penicillium verhagenii]